MQYWILKDGGSEGSAMIDALPEGAPAKWKFHKGQPLASEFPQDAKVRFSQNYPDDRRLYDFVETTIGLLVASERVKSIFENLDIENAEFLPITILDHAGGTAGENYFIVNLLGSADLIDMDRSDFRMGRVNKDQIKRMKRMVLASDKIPAGFKIGRASTMMRLYVMADEVKAAFEREGVTGYVALEADGWNGMDF